MTYTTRQEAVQAAEATGRHYTLCHTAYGWSFALLGKRK